MKVFKLFCIASISLTIFTACEISDDELILDEDLQQKDNIESGLYQKLESTIIVAPSGDKTGVTDADNIETALNAAKSTGGTVYLTDGYKKTTDHYYTSRNIVVVGFNGTLIGESKNKTIINAGRQSNLVGFAPAFSPTWTVFKPWHPLASTVLQLDDSTGDVTIKNLSILVMDDQPTDPLPDFYNDDGTYLWSAIELIGGEFNTIIENVNIEGKKTQDYGNAGGLNLAWGIHVMPWDISLGFPPLRTQGNLTIKNVTLENIYWDAILLMDYKDGSMIAVEDISAKNVGYGVAVSRITDSFVKVSNADISNHDSWWAQGMWFEDINSGLEATENKISNAKWFSSVFLWDVHGAKITNNKFIDVSSFGAAIALSGGSSGNTVQQNDFKDSNLPGWTTTSLDGPGAVFLQNTTQNNYVFEMKFSNNIGKTLCEMILDLGNNTIHNWQACENLGNKSSLNLKANQPDINLKHRLRSLLNF
jgi:parallel beta helix pectate lyase-like protein